MKTVKQTKILIIKISRLIAYAALVFTMLPSLSSATTQNLVENQIHKYIKTQIEPNPNKKIKIIVNPIDKRKKLAPCVTPIQITLTGKFGLRRNNTVSVVCQDQWKLYVAVRVQTLISIVTTTRNLSPGTRLSADNLTMSFYDVSTLRGETSESISSVLGSRVKRYVQQGRPLLANLVCLVCKGDPVTLYVRSGNLSIKSTGTALNDGSIGQVIAAKNNSSGRRVEGIVVAVGEIEIN